MAYALFIENEVPDQTSISEHLDDLFPPEPGRPDPLGSVFVYSVQAALEKLKLDVDLADRIVPEQWADVPPEVRDRLRKPPPQELYGISCDLELPVRPGAPADVEAGKSFLRLLSHWRNRHLDHDFKLIVCSKFPNEEPNVKPFCDGFVTKMMN